MIQTPAASDWTALGIDPTTDADEVRRAYRARLRDVGPEADPEGFQTLRAAYEKVLAAVDDARSTPRSDEGDHDAALVDRFLSDLLARRSAGDEAGAIALVDEVLASHRPGTAMAEMLADSLMEHLSLARNISPRLFRHLADRLDWRDVQGRSARDDPERHALVLDRIAAEDWYGELAGSPGDPDRQIETIMASDRERAAAALRASPISQEQRQHVRNLFEQLMSHATFVLTRFDGGTLALLREAVEGPPLLGEPTVAPPVPLTAATTSPAQLVSPQRRNLIRIGVFGLLGAVVAGKLIYSSKSSDGGASTALAKDIALPMLKDPKTAWLELVPGPDGVKVDWAPVMRMRNAIKELHVGYNEEMPTTLFPLPTSDVAIGFIAPPTLTTISMRILYSDGTWSTVRQYNIRKAGQ
ncbi:MAG: hypothetical protein ABI281_07595 [Caldimonas sp.]